MANAQHADVQTASQGVLTCAGSGSVNSNCASLGSVNSNCANPDCENSSCASLPTSRNTAQRAYVLEAVRALHTHPTSADIYAYVHETHPNVSRATVYRNLNLLAARGEVLRVEVPNGADHFDFNTAPHYHAKCRMCESVFDVDMPYQHDIAEKITDARGFAIERHHIIFEGICPSCQRS